MKKIFNLNQEGPHLWHTGAGVAGVWPHIGRESEGAVAPVDPAVGWGPRTQRESCLECSVGAPPSNERAPKVLPVPEQMELVKGALGAAEQGHVLSWLHHRPPLGWERGFLGQTWKEERQFSERGSSWIPCPSPLNWEFTLMVPLNSLLLSLLFSPLSLLLSLSRSLKWPPS